MPFSSSKVLPFFRHSSKDVISRLFSTTRQAQIVNPNNYRPVDLPPMMAFPQIVYPNVSHTFRNFFFTNFIIKPYFDNSFSRKTFMDGARAAVEYVSHCLAHGSLNELEESGAVSSTCLEELRQNLSKFNMSQRSLIATTADDITLNFIYQIGMIMDDHPEQKTKPGSNKQIRLVEITYVAHTLKNYLSIVSEGKSPSEFEKFVREKGGPIILNYRFIRDYTSGVEDSWTINAINHFPLVRA